MPANPVLKLDASPNAVLRSVDISAVRLEDTFWEPRRKINREITLQTQREHCERTGRVDNFRRASGKIQGAFQGIFFNDSDIYKWAEATAFSLAADYDAPLDAQLDAIIQEVADAQEANGYLNTYFTFERVTERFTNLKDLHEIYCAGHLIQAAVAHHRATGKPTFLRVACKLADHLYDVFGPGKRVGACGHEEAELALVELYRETGESRYLVLAECMTDARGRQPGIFGNSAYHQDHAPLPEQTTMIGHAVRHLYYVSGAADLCLETNRGDYRAALETLWRSFTTQQMYVTGGAGSRYEGEAFGNPYELPNDRAYTETCAAIGSVMWNWRMLHLTGEARFTDLMEHTLYNAVLPGWSLDGTQYFYENPLADRGKHRRQEWFGCACCPPNVARLIASLPGYFYSVAGSDAYVHLYAQGTAHLDLPNGGAVSIEVETNYPWEGEISIRVAAVSGAFGALRLRIPGWARGYQLAVNGVKQERVAKAGEYAEVSGLAAGDVVSLSLPMPVETLTCHSHVPNNNGRVALQRGPLIYCLEQVDNPDGDVWNLATTPQTVWNATFRPDVLGGVTVLQGEGVVQEASEWEGALYRRAEGVAPNLTHPVTLTAVPYCAWANREAGAMQVWIPKVS